MPECLQAAEELVRAVDGVDWDASEVDRCCRVLVRAAGAATSEERREALAVITERLARARVEDADGVAHVAISGGSLVEAGAPPGPLAAVLLERLPEVLAAARRYADRCLADLGEGDPADDEADEAEEADVLTEVDGRAIPLAVFRAHLAEDRGGGAALAYLRQWVLPAAAALTRDREALRRATADPRLRDLAGALDDSEAHWLAVLLGVELDARWLALCPLEGRGFELLVDGVVSNFDLHALLAGALIERGVPGEANPPGVLAYLRGESERSPRGHVVGSFNLYDHRAGGCDLRRPTEVPQDAWVWNEGGPRDVPLWEGRRTLLVGPPAYARTWSPGRTFSALFPSVEVTRELAADEVATTLGRLRAGTSPG